jgi:predicted ATPase
MIPGLTSTFDEDRSTSMRNNFSKFKAICRSFLHAVSSQAHPLVIFLDDLQWCDEASVQVIRSLISELESKHVLMILTFRNDENGGYNLSQIVNSEKTWNTTFISLELFDVPAVSNILHRVAGRDYSSCFEFAQTLVQKTNGNIYYLINFIKRMEDENVVKYSPQHRSWDWDVDLILVTTNVSENVADLVSNRLKKLSVQHLEVLKISAVLGYEFDFNILYDVISLEGILKDHISTVELSIIISECVKDGFLEKYGENKYKHSHDRTQACLYSLIGSEEAVTALHVRIGTVLYSLRDSYPDFPLILLAADHWNRGSSHTHDMNQIANLRQLNYLAGKEAIFKQSFHQSVRYFEMYLSLSPDISLTWSNDYNEAFDFFCSYTKALYDCGTFEKCIVASKAIIDNASSVEDKVPGFLAFSSSLSALGRNVEATNACHVALKLLGECIPRYPTTLNVLSEILKVRNALRGKKDEEILSLPVMTNTKKIAALQLYDRIAIQVSMNYQEKNLFVLVSHRMAYLSCEYGLNKKSSLGFAFYASILAFGNPKQAFRFGELALKLIDLLPARECECRTLTILHGLVFHWRDSFWETFNGFAKAYHSGMSMGDSESAFVASLGYLGFAFFGSPSLLQNEVEIRGLCNSLEGLPHELPNLIVQPCLQMTLNLLGKSGNRIQLNDENFDEKLWEEKVKEQRNPLLTHFMLLTKLQMAYFFDDTKEMEQQLKLVDRHVLVIRPSFLHYVGRFFCGIAYFSLFNRRKIRQFRKRGTKLCSALQQYFIHGVKNCEGYYYLLDALRLFTKKNYLEALHMHEKALQYGRENESIVFQAMCNEITATMMCSFDKAKSLEYFKNSIHLWEQWGAHSKVEHLTERMHHLHPG